MNSLVLEYKGYLITGNEGDSFDYIIRNGLLKAKREVWITSAKTGDFSIVNTRTNEAESITSRIYKMQEQGIKFRILLAPQEQKKQYQRAQTFYQKLSDLSNVEFHFCYNMHMKIVLIDDAWLYFGSANFTGAGLGSRTREGRNNFEIGSITVDKEVIREVEDLLNNIWNGQHCVNCYQKQKGYCQGIE